jgi:hypothetical protein
MNRWVRVLCTLYGCMVRLYPPGFRAAFGDEMRAVFAEAASDAASRGWGPLMAVWLRELRTYPGAVGSAYQRWVSRVGRALRAGGGHLMSERTVSEGLGDGNGGSWAIRDRGTAVLAALPPLILGLGIALAVLPMLPAGRTWFELAAWQQGLVTVLALLPAAVIGVGGVIALVRGIPDWGYTWIGSTLMGAAVLVKTIAEERADVGLAMVSPAVDAGIALAIVLAGGIVLLIAAWHGWAQAGLTGVGYVAIFGISLFSVVRAAPFNRGDLALLAAPMGLLQAGLIYLYVQRSGGRPARWGYLLGLWLLNGVPVLMAHRVWQPWLSARGRPSPVLPLLVIVTMLGWAGPIAGLLGRPLRRTLGRS